MTIGNLTCSFEKNDASSKPHKEESAALSENGGLIQPNDEFEDYAQTYSDHSYDNM